MHCARHRRESRGNLEFEIEEGKNAREPVKKKISDHLSCHRFGDTNKQLNNNISLL